jgi:MFS family permease
VPGVVAVVLGVAAALLFGRSVDVVRTDGTQSGAAPADRRRAQLRVFAFVAVSAVFGGLIFNGVTVALPKLFEEQLGSWSGSIAQVGLLTALAFAVAAFAQLPVGALLDRHGARPVVLTILALQVPLLAILGHAFGPAVLPVAIAALLLIFGEIPVTDWLLGRHVAGPWQSRVYAVSDLGGLGVSVIAVPAIAFLHELSGGFGLMFVLLGAASAAACAAALWLPGREAAAATALDPAS